MLLMKKNIRFSHDNSCLHKISREKRVLERLANGSLVFRICTPWFPYNFLKKLHDSLRDISIQNENAGGIFSNWNRQ